MKRKEEFNLSEKEKSILTKIYPNEEKRYYYNKEDVKEFIKELKKYPKEHRNNYLIDILAGDKLR